MNIAVIGMGYVGLTLSLHLAENGHTIYGYEVNSVPDVIEEGIDALRDKHFGKSIFINKDFNGIEAAIITVGTPIKDGMVNYVALNSALRSVKNMGCPVILRSTLAIGTMDKYVYLEDKAYCPERTAEGVALKELSELPQIISASNSVTLELCKKIFEGVPQVITDTFKEAEATKLICNVYRDMNFALGNVLSESVQSYGIDYNKVWGYATNGYPRGDISKEGFVGGACLSKDSHIFAEGLTGDCKDIILGHRNFNKSLEDKVVAWVNANVPVGSSLCLSGLSFKGNPDNSDTRDSSAVNIADKLRDTYALTLHDFNIPSPDLYGEYDAVIILNDNYRYNEIGSLKTKVIFDAYNVLGGETTLGNFLCKR